MVKARTVWNKYGLAWFSDDTGLEIDALNGAPGVYSARYAGSSKDPEQNMDKVLSELEKKEDRSAQFRTAVALISTAKNIYSKALCAEKSREKNLVSKVSGTTRFLSPRGTPRVLLKWTMPKRTA